MEAPNHTRFSESHMYVVLRSCAHGLMASNMPVQSSNTGYLQQIMSRALVLGKDAFTQMGLQTGSYLSTVVDPESYDIVKRL